MRKALFFILFFLSFPVFAQNLSGGNIGSQLPPIGWREEASQDLMRPRTIIVDNGTMSTTADGAEIRFYPASSDLMRANFLQTITPNLALPTLSSSKFLTNNGISLVWDTIDISDDSNLTAGDHITLTGDDLDVDDDFLLNTGDTGVGNYYFTNGNVGIGTIAPIKSLDVITSTGIGIGITTSGDRFVLTSTGNIGIGTSGPLAKLDIVGKFGVDSNGNLIKIDNITYDWPNDDGDAGEQLQTNGSGVLTWEAAGAGGAGSPGGNDTQIQYNDGGAFGGVTDFIYDDTNIGIGTTAPAYKLDVIGTVGIGTVSSGAAFVVASTGNVGIGSTAPLGKLIVKGVGTTTGIGLQTQNSSGTALVTMLDNGNVGIGTTGPVATLEIIESGVSPFKISNGVGGNGNFLTMDTNGNVGIGTVVPLTTLDVNGIITVTGNTKGEPLHLKFNVFDPLATQTEDNEICIWPVTDAALTITSVTVTLDATTNEIAGDLKYADTFIALANPVVINDFDTTSGVRVDTTITSAAVPAGKCMYLSFDSAPNTAIHQASFDIGYKY